MDLMITSKILETLETGVVLEVNADDLHVRAYIVVSAVDMAVIEKLIPLQPDLYPLHPLHHKVDCVYYQNYKSM